MVLINKNEPLACTIARAVHQTNPAEFELWFDDV
jgi:hypothetical protein